jgi:NitT/TauT family transport system permease protein
METVPDRIQAWNHPDAAAPAQPTRDRAGLVFGARVSPAAIRTLLLHLAGIAAMLLLWHIVASHTHRAIVASPQATFDAFRQLAADGTLTHQMWITLGRLLQALGMGSLLGMSLGLLAGVVPPVRAFLEPARWVAMTLPAVIMAVLGMLWFGMGSQQVIFLVTFIVTPILYVNTLAGIDALDRHLLEMGRIYRFSRWQMFTQLYLPGIGYSLIAGLTLATGVGVRAVILAELLGAFEGVGHSFNRAWTFLKTPDLFAWMLASLLLMMIVEFGLLYPIRRFFTRWNK